MIACEGNDQVSGWGGILLRAAYRLITPRSAAASGRRLTGQHPHAPALLRQCLTGTFLHRQRFSEGQHFCAPCRFLCFPVAVGLAQGKPPSDSVSMEHSWGKSPQKLLRCIIVEACQVGDYRSYFLLTHTASAPAHTPASRTTSDSLCGSSPCGVYSVVFNARCGFAPPGTCCRD